MAVENGEQQSDDDLVITAKWLLTAFFLGWGALFLRIVMQGLAAHLGLSAFRAEIYSALAFQTGTAFIWTLAWLTGGFLFGFIFGIPKVIAATTATVNPALNDPSQNPSSKLKVNTNLEDISDWLTKVLVGATLTQIVKVPGAIVRAAEFMSKNDLTEPISFNAALLVYYSSLGFLSGYILTRMFFARAFALADQGPSLSADAAKILDSANVGFGRASSIALQDSTLRKAALAADAVPITASLTGDEALRIAKGATLTGETERALTASKLAVQKNPDDPQAQLTYAWSLRKLGGSLGVVLPIVHAAAQKLDQNSEPMVLSSVYASLSYLWLYRPPPAGYEGALQALGEYDAKQGRPNPDIEINRACAFGQTYSYLTSMTEMSELSETARTNITNAREGALSAIRKAISLDPTAATRLKELLWVTADQQDNDLSGFQNDGEFNILLPKT